MSPKTAVRRTRLALALPAAGLALLLLPLLALPACPGDEGDDDDSPAPDDDDVILDDDDVIDDDDVVDDDDSAADDDDDSGVGTDDDDAAPAILFLAASRTGDLIAIDITTGVTSAHLDTAYDAGKGFGDIGPVSSAVVLGDDRVWLGTGGNGDACDGCILELDPDAGFTTLVADVGDTMSAVPGLAVNSSGDLFGMEGDGDSLFSIDTTTGVPTEISADIDPTASNYRGNGMTFSSTGDLIVGSTGILYSVDTGTGVGTQLGAFDFQGFPFTPDADWALSSMSTHPDGTIYGILKRSQGPAPQPNAFLVTVTPVGAVITSVIELDGRYDALLITE